MNRVVIQEGYSLPFAGYKKSKRRKAKAGSRRKKPSMKQCAKAWKGYKKRHKRSKYTSFVSSCMKGKIRIKRK